MLGLNGFADILLLIHTNRPSLNSMLLWGEGSFEIILGYMGEAMRSLPSLLVGYDGQGLNICIQ